MGFANFLSLFPKTPRAHVIVAQGSFRGPALAPPCTHQASPQHHVHPKGPRPLYPDGASQNGTR